MKKILNHLKENWIRHGFETLVVVVGILVAFTLNNWNEGKKARQLEIKILKEIRENIERDFEDHNQNWNFMAGTINASNAILYHLNNDLPYHDSLSVHFSWLLVIPDFDPVNSGYDLLVSSGVSSITNDSLRKDISYLYNNTYDWIEKFYRFLKNNSHLFLTERIVPLLKDFEFLPSSAEPRNYEALKSNDELKSYIEYNSEFFQVMKGAYEQRLLLAEDLMERINEEVKRLED